MAKRTIAWFESTGATRRHRCGGWPFVARSLNVSFVRSRAGSRPRSLNVPLRTARARLVERVLAPIARASLVLADCARLPSVQPGWRRDRHGRRCKGGTASCS
ncbi:MAG: hypothetical protein DMF96_24115 [Acidobacteria bacterium]|nr:MAG: hypothetical protein DMF96_24115 [Acidobacteriota bacterium]